MLLRPLRAEALTVWLVPQIYFLSFQESKQNITKYLSPISKNRNDYIPGTNIRKNSLKNDASFSEKENFGEASFSESMLNCDVNDSCASDVGKTFLEDDEGDELLANLDL